LVNRDRPGIVAAPGGVEAGPGAGVALELEMCP
jgi:hypothetical protein